MLTKFRVGSLVLVAAGVLAAITLGGAAPAAVAHDSLIKSSPAAGSTVTELDAVALTFSDVLLNLGGMDNAFVVQVIGRDGRYFESGCAEPSGAVITTATNLGEAGEYTVQWQVVSADGHAISDTFSFDYAPEAGTTPAPGLAQPFSCGNEAEPEGTDASTTDQGSTEPSNLLIGLAAGGGFIVLAGLTITLLIRRSRRSS
jgi:hypothetical protein